MEQTTTVVYKGKEYPLKSFNGLTFATIDLIRAMQDSKGKISEDEETVSLEDSIAFFFSPIEFDKYRSMELYQIYNEFE